MKTKILVSAVALTLSGAAFAQNATMEPLTATPDYDAPVIVTPVSNRTRAQVMAEAAEARRLGLIATMQRQIPVGTPAQERQILEAGLRATTADGSLPAGYVAVEPVAAPRTRAQAQAEAVEAQRLGLTATWANEVPLATATQEAQIRAAGQRTLVNTASSTTLTQR